VTAGSVVQKDTGRVKKSWGECLVIHQSALLQGGARGLGILTTAPLARPDSKQAALFPHDLFLIGENLSLILLHARLVGDNLFQFILVGFDVVLISLDCFLIPLDLFLIRQNLFLIGDYLIVVCHYIYSGVIILIELKPLVFCLIQAVRASYEAQPAMSNQ
jgi:hypothetical protein